MIGLPPTTLNKIKKLIIASAFTFVFIVCFNHRVQAQAVQKNETLFKEHNLSIKLTAVEKVFGDRIENIKTYDKTLYQLLINHGIDEKQRVLYEAGNFYFKIKMR